MSKGFLCICMWVALPFLAQSQASYTNTGQKITMGLEPYGCFLGNGEKAGELTYSYLGSSANPISTYNFVFKQLIPCSSNSSTPARALYITNLSTGATKAYTMTIDSVRLITDLYSPCIVLPQPPCYTAYYLHATVDLPAIEDKFKFGWAAVVEDCCRDTYQNIYLLSNTLYSIINPLPGTSLACNPPNPGQVYNSIANYVKVPPLWDSQSRCCFANSSPLFQEDTILYLCKGQTFSHRFHAVDPDGDSLTYGFYAAKTYTMDPVYGGAVIHRSFPFPDAIYNTFSGYRADEQLGPGVQIDPKTGIMQGVMNDTGNFMVTIAASEYRKINGMDSLIGVHYKDVIVKVFECEKLPKPQAILPALVNGCNDYTINFPNNSIPLFSSYRFNTAFFEWNFGDGDTAKTIYPAHTYKDTGQYNVRLIIFPGLSCADTTYSKVLVYPELHASFKNYDSCTDRVVTYINTSTTTIGSINSAVWTFENDDSTLVNKTSTYSATHVYEKGNRSFLAKLKVTTTKGCEATDSTYINIYLSPPQLPVHDTIISVGASYRIQPTPSQVDNYSSFKWSPSAGLDRTDTISPLCTYDRTIKYYVNVKTKFGCSMEDTLRIRYYKGPDIYVPTAFTPNGDGLNDIFRPFPVGMSKMDYFKVYNRWGQEVFSTRDYLKGWDGKINYTLAEQGAYIWEVSGVDNTGKPVIKKGTVLLIR